MKTLFFILAAALLASCQKAQTATQPPPPPQTPPPVSLSGTWELHMGKALDTLKIEDDAGVLSGVRDLDPRWHGGLWIVNGLRVGEKVQFTTAGDKASYSYAGTIKSEDEISGEVSVVTFDPPTTGTALWIAHRIDHDIAALPEYMQAARDHESEITRINNRLDQARAEESKKQP